MSFAFLALPKYASMLKEKGWKPDPVSKSAEYVRVRVVDRTGRVLFESKDRSIYDRSKEEFRFRSRHKRGFQTYYIYSWYGFGSQNFQVTLKVPTVLTNLNGWWVGSFPSSNASYDGSIATARARRRAATTRTRNSFASSSKAVQRKNPETRTKQVRSYSWTSQSGVSVDTMTNVNVYNRTWTGVRTPNFARLKSKGLLPVNPHTVSLRIRGGGEFLYTNWNSGTQIFEVQAGPFETYWSFPGAPTHNVSTQNMAIRRLINQTTGGISANLAQDIAQIGQTTRMIGDTTRRIAGAINYLKRGKFDQAISQLWTAGNPRFRKNGKLSTSKSTASNWLELQYGWKPLLMDVRGSMEALARYNLANNLVHRATSSATIETTTRTPLFHINGGPQVGLMITTSRTTTRYGMRYKLQDRLTAFLAQTGFTNPINLAWELLPYSFVVDWFLPIGPYLETLSAWDGLQFVDGYQISFTKQSTFATLGATVVRPTGFQNHTHTSETRGGDFQEWVVLGRAKLTSFPSARFPQFKNPFSVDHALNGLALLRSAFR